MVVTASKDLDSARLGFLDMEALRHGGTELRKRTLLCASAPLCLCVEGRPWGDGSRVR